MRPRQPICTHLFVITFAAALLAPTAWAEAPQHYSKRQLYKNWALSTCLAKGLPSKDAEATSGGYLEFADAPAEAYQAGSVLIDQFLAKPYESQSGEDLATMKCIDLFHSKELDSLARKYAR